MRPVRNGTGLDLKGPRAEWDGVAGGVRAVSNSTWVPERDDLDNLSLRKEPEGRAVVFVYMGEARCLDQME